MKNYQFKIFASLVLLWVGNLFGIEVQIYLGIFLVLTVGVFHGTNDLFLIDNGEKNKKIGFLDKRFYLLLLVVNCALFIVFPKLAFGSFLMFSVYHFGEQHFENSFSNNRFYLNYLTIISFGSLLFGAIFFYNQTQVLQIIYEISGWSWGANTLKYFFITSGVFYAFSFIFKSITDVYFKQNLWNEFFSLLLLYVIIVNGSLIWAFTIYFIIWHSMPSIESQIKSFSENMTKKAVYKYISNGFLNWIISILSLSILLFFLREKQLLYSILFSFLAAITLPHVVLMKLLLDKTIKK